MDCARPSLTENVAWLLGAGVRPLCSRLTPFKIRASPLSEITSSGLTQFYSNVNEDGPNRLGAAYGAVNFGTLDIDWCEAIVHASIRNMNG